MEWPVLDMGFVTAKVMLASNVTFSFSRLILSNWRKGPAFLAPGLDLIAANPETVNRTDASLPNLRFSDVVWIQRGCIATDLGQMAAVGMPRPAFVPGAHNLTDALPQPGCVNSSAAPLLQRCWPQVFEYVDVVTYGHNLNGMQQSVPGGYVLWLQNTPVRCEKVLDAECVDHYAVFGCYFLMYPDIGTGTGVAGNPHSDNHRLAAILGGVLGGVALLAVLAGVLVGAVGLRRRPYQRHDLLDTDGGGGGGSAAAMSCDDPASGGPGSSRSRSPPPASVGSLSKSWEGAPPVHRSSAGRTSKDSAAGSAGGGDETRAGAATSCGGQSKQLHRPVTTACKSEAVRQPSFLSALKDAAFAAPVTPRTPLQPDVNLRVSLGGGELTLLPGVIGKGNFGRVVPGWYAGQPVAVKLLDYGLVMQCHGGGGRGGSGGGGRGGGGDGGGGAAAPAGMSLLQMISFDPASTAVAASPPAGDTTAAAAAAGVAASQQAPLGPSAAFGTARSGGAGSATAAATPTAPTAMTALASVAALDWRQVNEAAFLRSEANVGVPTKFTNEIGGGGGIAVAVHAAAAGAAAAGVDDDARLLSADVRQEAVGSDPAQKGLLQEVEILGRCRHPNVVRLLAACINPPHMCLVMELMETSLDRLLYGKGGGGQGAPPLMPLDKVLHIGLQVAVGLEYLHPTIMHRDLKPANVLLQNASSPSPIVKLADFGLSRLQTSVLITANVGVGTVAYMAPETLSAMNCVVTHHVDIYALGVILWELLAGVRPWAGLDIVQIAVAVDMQRRRPPLELLPPCRCPPKLRSLIQRCWEHVPQRRPAAAEVVKALLQCQMMMTMTHKDGKIR